MRIHHLTCGCMCPVGGRLWDDWSHGATANLVCHCWAMEAKDGLILVDTGLGTRDVAAARKRISPFFRTLNRPRFDEEDTALRQIERLGFRAADVKHILLTHLDFDHAGGMVDFPAARVHVTTAEYEAALRPRTWRDRRRYRPAQWDGIENRVLYDLPSHTTPWFGFAAMPVRVGDEEILMISLPGHSPGHVGVAVRSRGAWALHAGDAYFNRSEIKSRRYRCPPAARAYQWFMETDRGERLSTQRRLRGLVKEQGARVRIYSSHDPVELVHAAAH